MVQALPCSSVNYRTDPPVCMRRMCALVSFYNGGAGDKQLVTAATSANHVRAEEKLISCLLHHLKNDLNKF